jgi:putative redox protein
MSLPCRDSEERAGFVTEPRIGGIRSCYREFMATEIAIHISQTSPTTSEATIRKHRVLIDRPEPKGGSDEGPMGGELFLAAIGGCFMSNLLAAIRAREAAVTEAKLEIIGTLADSPSRFSAVDMFVSANYEDDALFEKLVDIADRGCIMMNTLRGKLEVNLRIATSV